MNIDAPFLGFENLSLFGDGQSIVTLMDAIPNWLLKWGKTTADIKYKNDATEKVFGEEMRTITKCSGVGPNERDILLSNRSFLAMFIPLLTFNVVTNSAGHSNPIQEKKFKKDHEKKTKTAMCILTMAR